MRIAIVAGIVVPHDAISAAVAGQARIAASIPTVESVTVFAQYVDRELSCPSHVVTDPWRLARHPDFAGADLVIFHWGIHYALFDVVTLCAGTATQHIVVHFHNCTPRELVAEADRDVIDRSLSQLQHAISLGLRFWTFSDFNELTLLSWGVTASRISFVPFPIDLPPFESAVRTSERVELLAVGRRVPAKGLHILIEAFGLVDQNVRDRAHLRIAGSSGFSNTKYLASLHSLVLHNRLEGVVEFVDDPTNEELWELYRTSDVVVSPSFHEGLCVPIIEGYAFGCRAIGTTSGNLAFIVQDPDPRVDPGDPAALADAIETMVGQVAGEKSKHRIHSELVNRYSYESSRTILQRELYRLAASGS